MIDSAVNPIPIHHLIGPNRANNGVGVRFCTKPLSNLAANVVAQSLARFESWIVHLLLPNP